MNQENYREALKHFKNKEIDLEAQKYKKGDKVFVLKKITGKVPRLMRYEGIVERALDKKVLVKYWVHDTLHIRGVELKRLERRDA